MVVRRVEFEELDLRLKRHEKYQNCYRSQMYCLDPSATTMLSARRCNIATLVSSLKASEEYQGTSEVEIHHDIPRNRKRYHVYIQISTAERKDVQTPLTSISSSKYSPTKPLSHCQHLVPLGRVVANLTIVQHRANIARVVRAALARKCALDQRQNSTSVADSTGVGHWVSSVVGDRVERTWVRCVESETREGVPSSVVGGPWLDGIAGLLANEVVDVGTDVPAAEGGEVPVGGYGGDLRVVGVEGGVGGSDQALGNSVTKEHGEHVVGDGVGVVLVEGQEDEGLGAVEVGVGQEGLEEGLGPGTSGGDRSVVSIVGHVGCNEHPLRQPGDSSVSILLLIIISVPKLTRCSRGRRRIE